MIEAEFQDKLVDYLRKRHCFVKPLVGNTLMAGMPDLWIANSKGWAGHAELKMWKKKHDPTEHEDFVSLLDGPQVYVIQTEFWTREIFCPIIALSKRDEVNAWIYYGDNRFYEKRPWQDIAEQFIAQTKEYIRAR